MPSSSRVALPSTMYGSSWVSRPMPWPVRWMNHSPYPASSMIAPGRLVHALGGDAGPDPDGGRLLGALEHLVVRGEIVGRAAHGVRAGAVGAVAGRHGAPDVDHDDVPAANHPVGDLVVRRGGVRAGAHDHEVGADVTFGEDGLGDLHPDLAFGLARPQPVGDVGVHPVDRLARLPERGDLGRRLTHPQRRDHLGRQPQARVWQRLRELEDVQRPHPVAQRDQLRAADLVRDDPERVRELAPGDHVDVQLAGRRGLGRLQLEAGHDQERVVVGGHRQAGEPLQLLGVVAGHVAQVGPGGEQQDVDARLSDCLLHPGESLGRVEGGIGGHEIS